MIELISQVFTRISSFFKQFQIRQVLAVALVGFMLMTTNANPDFNNKALGQKVRERAHQTTEGQRPRTTGEWQKEASEDAPLNERIQQITEDSAEAFKQWGKQYPDTARRSTRELQND
jgi:hypothetical protein